MNGRQAMQAHKSGETAAELITKMQPAFQMALGTQQMAERFCRVALTQIRINPKLASCSQMSLMGSLMMAAQLKLEFSLGYAYIIPYWSSKTNSYEAQFQIGYQGYIDLFYRHPLAEELYAEIVYRNDEFKIIKGTRREIVHNPVIGEDKGEPIGYYAVARLKTGAYNFAYMSLNDAISHMTRYARADKSGKHGIWDDNFDEMALKTCIKKVLKLMPKSVDMAAALDMDEATKRPATIEMARNIEDVPSLFASSDEVLPLIEDGVTPEPEKIKKAAKEEVKKPAPATPVTPIDKRAQLKDMIREANLPEEAENDWLSAVDAAQTTAEVYRLETAWGTRNEERGNS